MNAASRFLYRARMHTTRCEPSRLPVLTLFFIATAAALPAATLNDLYFGLDNMRGFAETYWWFLADGRVLHGLPRTGVTPADFDAACTASPALCGTYSLNGAKLTIKYRSGQTENWTYATLKGGIQLNYLILTPVEKYAPGARLSGTFSRPFSSRSVSGPSSAVTVTAPSFFTFKPDGTYQGRVIAGVDTVSAVKGANIASSRDNQWSGTYTVKDNVLMLVKNGQNERHMIFPAPGGNLNIDGQVYTKQK
jgi:hypothetical protein